MSEEKKEEAAEAPAGPKPSKLPMILVGVNFLAIAAAMGTLVYVKFMYKRPSITEEAERQRLAAAAASPVVVEPGTASFDPVTINIASTSGKSRYATIGFTLELRDRSRNGDIEAVRPLIMDRFLGMLGRKQFQELSHVQGRYVLKTEMIEAFNKVIFENAGRIQAAPAAGGKAAPAAGGHGGGGHGGGDAGAGAHGDAHETKPIKDLITNVFFTQFTVQ